MMHLSTIVERNHVVSPTIKYDLLLNVDNYLMQRIFFFFHIQIILLLARGRTSHIALIMIEIIYKYIRLPSSGSDISSETTMR